MPELTDQETKAAAAEFRGMAEYWNLVAANTYNEWAAMKFKKTQDGSGHKSKKDFEDYRRMVYGRHKHFRKRADLCTAVEKMLLGDESIDLTEVKEDSAVKNAGKIILGNFKLLKP